MNDSKTSDASKPNYTMGYSDEFLKLLSCRNAEINAAHLLRTLRPVTAFLTSVAVPERSR